MVSALTDDHLLAERLATSAGEILVKLRAELADLGADPKELKDRGDQAAHDYLVKELRAERPLDGLLSEEDNNPAKSDESPNAEERAEHASRPDRLNTSRVWIIDPLDGTREYSEVPRTDWAVHVALAIDGKPLVGAVALPAQGITLSTANPPAIPAVDLNRVAVSRSRPPKEAGQIVDAMDGSLVPMGSAGAKAMAILLGEADIYPHSGGQYEWDSCAPAAVALAAGLWASRIDGSPLVYNNEDPYLPDLLFCRPEVAQRALAAANDS